MALGYLVYRSSASGLADSACEIVGAIKGTNPFWLGGA